MRFPIEHLLRNVARSGVHSAQRCFLIQSDIGMNTVPNSKRKSHSLPSASGTGQPDTQLGRPSLPRLLGIAVREFARVVHALLHSLQR